MLSWRAESASVEKKAEKKAERKAERKAEKKAERKAERKVVRPAERQTQSMVGMMFLSATSPRTLAVASHAPSWVSRTPVRRESSLLHSYQIHQSHLHWASAVSWKWACSFSVYLVATHAEE